MRAVFDPNVVVSALVFGRRLAWLRQAWAQGVVIPVVCRESAAELLRVLAYPKFRLDAAGRDLLLADYRYRDDLVFLRLAIGCGAELLVSGHAELTETETAYAVVSPATLRKRLAR